MHLRQGFAFLKPSLSMVKCHDSGGRGKSPTFRHPGASSACPGASSACWPNFTVMAASLERKRCCFPEKSDNCSRTALSIFRPARTGTSSINLQGGGPACRPSTCASGVLVHLQRCGVKSVSCALDVTTTTEFWGHLARHDCNSVSTGVK